MAQTFLRGAFLLAAAGLVSRLFGLYRLLLPGLIGAVGVGLYHMAYPIYATALALSTGGLPVAVSKLVAERAAQGRHGAAHRVFRVSLLILVPVGLLMAAALFFLAPQAAAFLARDPRAALSVRAIAPAVLLVALTSVYRGYFQGYQDMAPTAISQIIEQVARVGTLVFLVIALAPMGVSYQAAGATFGAVVGAGAGLVYLFVRFHRRGQRLPSLETGPVEPMGPLIKSLVAMALPVAVAGLAVPLMQLGDLLIVPTRLLEMGIHAGIRTALYGELSGYAMPVANLPSIATFAIAVALVPAISEARARGETKAIGERLRAGLRTANMIALPSALGLMLLGPAIMNLLFKTPGAGSILSLLGPSVFFLGLVQVSAGALQGLGAPGIPVRNLFLAVLFKLGLTWFLVPSMGVSGAALATSGAYLLAAVSNLIAAFRMSHERVHLMETFIRPALGLPFLWLFVEAGGLLPHLLHIGPRMGALLVVLLGVFGYFLGLLLLGGLTEDDFHSLPKGDAVRRIMISLGLWRK